MNLLARFHDPIALTVGWWLIHSLWVGALAGAFALLLRAVLPKQSTNLRCWCFLGLLLAIPITAGLWVNFDRPDIAVSSILTAEAAESPDEISTERPRTEHLHQQAILEPPGMSVQEVTVATESTAWRQDSIEERVTSWVPWLVVGWLGGVAICAARLLLHTAGLWRLRRSARVVADDQVRQLLKSVARRMGLKRPIDLLQSSRCKVPATIGLIRPVIFLPLSVLGSLTPQEIEAVLAHECAHIRRNDFLWNALQCTLEVLLFFHPVVWWLSHQIRHERELACDEMAVSVCGNPLRYARALTELAAHVQNSRLAMSAGGGDLRQRVAFVLGRPTGHPFQSSVTSALLALALIAVPTGLWLYTTPSEAQATADQPTESTAVEATPKLELIQGVVEGPRGKPLADATVFLRRRPFGSDSHQELNLARTTTSEDGRFRFEDVPMPEPFERRTSIFPLDVIAMKPLHSIRWRRITNATTDIRLRLKKETVLQGSLQDDAGQPLAGARIKVLQLMSLNTLQKIDVGHGRFPSRNGDSYLDVATAEQSVEATTDLDGSFAIRQLPRRVGLVLEVVDERIQPKTFYAATSVDELAPIPAGKHIPVDPANRALGRRRQRQLVEKVPIHLTPAELRVDRAVRIRFQVVDDSSEKAVEDAVIAVQHQRRSQRSDQDGFVMMAQLDPSQAHVVTVTPPPQSRLLPMTERLPVSNRLEREYQIRLKPGARISGRVVDRKSQGLPGVQMTFQVTNDNSRFDAMTRGDGTFEIIAPEQEGVVSVGRVPAGVLPIEARLTVTDPISPTLDEPTTGLTFELERQPKTVLRFVDDQVEPVASSIDLRIYQASNRLRTVKVDVGADGTLDVGNHIIGSDVPFAIQALARSIDGKTAGFFRSIDVKSLQDAEHEQIVSMRPMAAVIGTVRNRETNEPLAGAVLHLGVGYTPTQGQNVGSYTSGTDGRFRFEDLVPGMRYSIGASAKDYASLNSIHTRFHADASQTHEVDLALSPLVPSHLADLSPVEAPTLDGLTGPQALKRLKDQYKTADDDYRKRLKEHSDAVSRRQIVRQREPTPAYAAAGLQLAKDHQGTETELKTLIWLCKLRLVAGTASRYRHIRNEAANRIMANYAERGELGESTQDVIYASTDWLGSAEKLMENPNREVQGRACNTAADILAQAYAENGHQEEDRLEAIELYQRVIDDYSEISHWRYGTLAKRAREKLFQLTELQIGTEAPDIVGVDLAGKKMKLSDFRGNVVIIHYWESGLDSFSQLDEFMNQYRDRPLVVLGVCTDKSLAEARTHAKEKPPEIRHWHDPDRAIHARWSNSWPNTHVISHDGVILYKGQRESRIPLADVLVDAIRATVP